MQTYMKTLSGGTIILEVGGNDTIESVKAKIRDKEGFPIEQQRLFLRNMHLDNNSTLSNYEIHKESALQLVHNGSHPTADQAPIVPVHLVNLSSGQDVAHHHHLHHGQHHPAHHASRHYDPSPQHYREGQLYPHCYGPHHHHLLHNGPFESGSDSDSD